MNCAILWFFSQAPSKSSSSMLSNLSTTVTMVVFFLWQRDTRVVIDLLTELPDSRISVSNGSITMDVTSTELSLPALRDEKRFMALYEISMSGLDRQRDTLPINCSLIASAGGGRCFSRTESIYKAADVSESISPELILASRIIATSIG